MRMKRGINQNEKANFRSLLESDTINRIEDRLKVVDTFLSTEEHITLEDLHQLLKKNGYDFDFEFVKQCMDRMVELGFAQRKKFENQPVRYEHRHLGKHHDHIICTKCGKIVEFENEEMENLQRTIASQYGFQILQHRMEIYGLCSDCLASRKPLMPLSMARPGEAVVIREITGGATARGRLSALGMRQGDVVEIISNNGCGRLILAHDCTRLALGRGIAHKILVSPAKEKPKPTCD